MTRERLKEIMDKLGMTDEELVFPKSNDYMPVLDFVEDLTLFNDLEAIKKLLVAIILESK